MRRVTALYLIMLAINAVPALAQDSTFTLTSTDVKTGAFTPAQIFNGFGCTGTNVSPALVWKGAPSGTRSFVLTVYDPDAPTGSGFGFMTRANSLGLATFTARHGR